MKIKRIYFEITSENQIGYYYSLINSYSSVYLISNTEEFLKCFSNFTKEELEKISDDEFKNFVETNLKDFGYMKEKIEKLNTFIQEKQKTKFKKINNLSNKKI